MSDRKKMKKLHEKKIASLKKQIEVHRSKLKNINGRYDTTHDYWEAEIKGFEEDIKESEKYLEEH